MEVIAYKSSYKQYFAVFLSVMAAVLSVFFFFMKMLVWAIGLLAFCVIFVVAAIFWFRQPRELITLNNDMLEIYYGKETKYVALVDIVNVKFYASQQFASFSYGRLDIFTSEGDIMVDNVSDLHNVAMRITELVTLAKKDAE